MNNDNFKWDDDKVVSFMKWYSKYPDWITGVDPIRKGLNEYKASNTSSNERYWEILEFRTPYFGSLDVPFTRNNVGNFSTGLNGRVHTHSEEYLLKMDATMKAVRRVSDGVVFSVGDEVETNRGRGQHIIKEFKVIDNDMCVGMETFQTFYEFLSRIQPLPKRTKLFTELQRIEHLEERIAYIEKKLNIEG